jgi:ATP-binding cassette subfamily F protein uup
VLVDLQGVGARTADRVLFDDLSLTVSDGDRVGVVGTNGTGKSTLLRMVAGVDPPDRGQVRRGRGARVGFLDQVPQLSPGTVRSAVGEGWEAEAALDRLGMSDFAGADLDQLSGGQSKRVALARVLAHPSELLVLDEPTNHLDLGAVWWLEQRLLAFGGGLVLVTHDRHLLDRVTTRMLELDRGVPYVHEGGYASYLEARAEREERAASAESSRRNLARRELAWLRRGAQARSRKPQARVEAAVRLIESRPEPPARPDALGLQIGTPRLGDKVVELHGVGYTYPSTESPVLDGVSLSIGRRERLGVVGANGTGKSTLLDLVAGRRQPSVGTVEVGPTVEIGYYDQLGVALDGGARVQDLVAGPHRAPGNLADIELMKRFWFTGELPFARVESLSGGERRRLQLLLVVAARPNVLLLDEPTNDLDLDTLRILEEFTEDWPGALVVVSHDRVFLERTTTRLVAVGSDGSLTGVPRGVEGWVTEAERRSKRPVPGTRADSAAPARRADPVSPARSGPPGAGGAESAGRLMRQAEKEMARHQRRLDRLEAELQAASGHQEMARVGAELVGVQAELADVEERWLLLAEGPERDG